ncbi:sialic acid-binding Ig-like lectin 7 isoform X3 [Cervus canadensis]|uniref:sialic acid-binding Ig-like lectin 7 isoform X3 n=1 Tax=Cervus canadensis TaxID=1574408 RepID=UPI001CA30F15|nr:sialic acid-binding Ig-like lectin 7 isoform X3 [Cervus canadensis]
MGPPAFPGPPLLHGPGRPSSPSVPAHGAVSVTLWLPVGASSFPPHIRGASLPSKGTRTGSALADADMGPLLLLPLLWGGSLQELPGFELRVQESVTVQACMDVRVACSFSYPWSSAYWSAEPSIYWFREGDTPYDDAVATNARNKRVKPETQGRFRLVGDPRDKDCSLIIKEARLSDSGAYYLRVERGLNEKYSYHDKKLNLQVTVPEKPDIQFLEPLESGRPTKLTCSLSLACDDRHPLLFSWVGDALDAMNLNTIHSPELTLTPRPQDHDSKLTCRVTLQGLQVTLERTVQLNVSYAPRNVRISLSFRNVTELSVFYSCRWVPPDDRSWTPFLFFWLRCSWGDPMVNMNIIRKAIMSHLGFPGTSVVKSQPAMQKMRVHYLAWEDPLEKGMATHSSILAWEIPGLRSPAGYTPWGRRVGHSIVSKPQHFSLTSGENSPALGTSCSPLQPAAGRSREGLEGERETVRLLIDSPSPAYGVHLPLLHQPVFITCCLPGFLLGLPHSFPAFGALPP